MQTEKTKETGTMGMIYELDDTEKGVLMNEAIKRARPDLNDDRPLTEMSLSEEQRELSVDASSLAYSAIRHSGLWRSLTNEQWDAKAATYGWLVVGLLNNLINEDLTALEAESEEAK